ncbi:16S RNA G1207 methylase RsmC [Zafaria cholistanensis]|uniref:16S RNA G1207 methylase RsmC n=1 Tax=Zafaria cholistanensis TaxID=1682741 RepID=A0A5A7NRG3_9MICC|nr:methyltransferase [Zafaria cholistanensis]GER23433.1 16S RNA G1207 methylase RsmC [Zafaria cholistanensis]
MSGALDHARLRRWPDVEAENLFAYDAGDQYLLESAAAAGLPPGREIVVVNDHYGALTLGLAAQGATGLRVHQDALSGERAIDANAARLGPELGLDLSGAYRHLPLGRELFEGATLVLLQLPRSLDALDEIAWQAARWADPRARLLAVGRVKHMGLAMNEVLGKSFASVTAGLARQKSRVLAASLPRGAGLPPARFPLRARHRAAGTALELRAFGATFGGAKLDPGTRFLLEHLDGLPAAGEAVDLGCGNGTIAAFVALARPGLRVLACDQSASAVASTAATAEANGVGGRVVAVRDDALSALGDGSRDLVLLNPPFHMGNTVHAGIALKLFADAGRVLAPGGQLWCVWNSHLRYRPQLERLVGPTRQVARNAKFTVTVSAKP